MLDVENISMNYVKKENLYGSADGIRYMLYKEDDLLKVCIWPEPLGYKATSEELKEYADFSFVSSGIEAAIDFINKKIDAISRNNNE